MIGLSTHSTGENRALKAGIYGGMRRSRLNGRCTMTLTVATRMQSARFAQEMARHSVCSSPSRRADQQMVNEETFEYAPAQLMSIRMRTHVNLPLNVLRCTFHRWAVPRGVGWFCSRLVLGSGSRSWFCFAVAWWPWQWPPVSVRLALPPLLHVLRPEDVNVRARVSHDTSTSFRFV